MLIGIIFYRKSYPWYKHVGTFLLCSGIVAFSYWKQSGPDGASISAPQEDTNGLYSLCIGRLLVVMNLSLDGTVDDGCMSTEFVCCYAHIPFIDDE
jgi:hypothetical protein